MKAASLTFHAIKIAFPVQREKGQDYLNGIVLAV
jgi:hypothetical protein